MTTSSLARPAFSQQEPAWPRLPAAPGQVTRSLCYRGLAALGAVELALILLSLVIAAASHSSVAQALVNLSPALVITGCVATGRAAGLLRAALAAGLTQRTALAAGLAVTASYALAQAPWAVLTTVLARAVPSEAEPGLLTPWAVPGWVLACLGAQLFVLIFVLLQDSGLRASWSWALTGLIVIGIGGGPSWLGPLPRPMATSGGRRARSTPSGPAPTWCSSPGPPAWPAGAGPSCSALRWRRGPCCGGNRAASADQPSSRVRTRSRARSAVHTSPGTSMGSRALPTPTKAGSATPDRRWES